jgi:hypothetical protein
MKKNWGYVKMCGNYWIKLLKRVISSVIVLNILFYIINKFNHQL